MSISSASHVARLMACKTYKGKYCLQFCALMVGIGREGVSGLDLTVSRYGSLAVSCEPVMNFRFHTGRK
jgi:hypothetical protein